MTRVYKIHRRDPNFPATVLAKIQQLLGMPSSTNKHQTLYN